MKSKFAVGLITSIGLVFLGLTFVSPTIGSPAKDEIKLEPLNWQAFQAKLAKAKAENYKYTIVDAWATNCGPCKENFPHLVELHKKYADQGLQVISLSLDDTTDEKALSEANAFLISKGAKFSNILLDEEYGAGYEKLEINAIPAVFLYGPDGKELKRFTLDDPNHQFTYKEVEEAVAALIGAKSASK